LGLKEGKYRVAWRTRGRSTVMPVWAGVRHLEV
jgi:hypothetical protein